MLFVNWIRNHGTIYVIIVLVHNTCEREKNISTVTGNLTVWINACEIKEGGKISWSCSYNMFWQYKSECI